MLHLQSADIVGAALRACLSEQNRRGKVRRIPLAAAGAASERGSLLKRRQGKQSGRQQGARHDSHSSRKHPAPQAKASSYGRTAEGIVSANRAGFGFVRVEGQEESVFLPPPQMMGVMHGDRVRVSRRARPRRALLGQAGEDPRARAPRPSSARWKSTAARAFVTAADRRIGMRCLVPPADLGGARHGDWVIAAVTRYAGQGSNPQARVTRRLDPEKPVELAMRSGHRALRPARRVFARGGARGGSLRQRGGPGGRGAARRHARPAAGHHRRRRCQGLRRRGVCRAASQGLPRSSSPLPT